MNYRSKSKRNIPFINGIDEWGSTNELMKQYCEYNSVASGSIFYTNNQTQGRGYSGNSWESEKGKNLTFSVFFIPKHVPCHMPFLISEISSLSVKHTLDKYIPDVTVKWPNDVYYRDGKISGILIENVITGGKIEHSIIGIGLNINQIQFVSDAPNPISLSQITGETYELMDILDEFDEIFTAQSRRLNNRCFEDIHNDYLNVIHHRDGYHKYCDANGVFEAKIHNIEPTGHLILERTDASLSRYAFKEVSFL